jgi:NADPH-dependent glutamate synthase beta subunit-like oxidoreductase
MYVIRVRQPVSRCFGSWRGVARSKCSLNSCTVPLTRTKPLLQDFDEVAQDPRFRFIGNCRLGRDVSAAELRGLYDGVVLACGAQEDRHLGLPGETLRNVLPAREFVAWFNGHPDFAALQPALDVEDVVIIGQGNVALDCARVLAKSVDELRTTDIASPALAALASSKVKRVHVVGRRGAVQAAFTMKELRELTKLGVADLRVDPAEIARGLTAASQEEIATTRSKSRMSQLLGQVAAAPLPATPKPRQLDLRFLLSPTAFEPSSADPSAVGAVRFDVMALEGPAGKQAAVSTGAVETIPGGLVLRAIGYKSKPIEGVPFDAKRCVVPSDAGRVTAGPGAVVPRLYVSGWLKRGPTGIIGSNIPDAHETVAAVVEDLGLSAGGGTGVPPVVGGGTPALLDLLASRNLKVGRELVDWQGVQRIHAAEAAAGALLSKPRDKMVTRASLLAAAAVH